MLGERREGGVCDSVGMRRRGCGVRIQLFFRHMQEGYLSFEFTNASLNSHKMKEEINFVTAGAAG